MANKLFPLFSQVASEEIVLVIAATATSATHSHTVDSRTLLIDAQGANSAPTHVVNIIAPTGMIFFVDFKDSGALNANSASQAASSVTLKKGKNEILLDAVGEAACVLVTDDGFVDGSNFLGSAFGATSGATFS